MGHGDNVPISQTCQDRPYATQPPSFLGYAHVGVFRRGGYAPSLSGIAPVSKVPQHDAEAFAVVQAPAPVSFLNLLEARYARLPRGTALHHDGWLVAVLHRMNRKRHQGPELLDKRG
jgi:hypothetical protein